MGEETIENVTASEPETIPESETETSDSVGGGTESVEVHYYDDYLDVIIHYQAFQSAVLIIILFLCTAVLGSQFMRSFWGR